MDTETLRQWLVKKYPRMQEEHLISAESLCDRFQNASNVDVLKEVLSRDREQIAKQAHLRTGNLLYAIALTEAHLESKQDSEEAQTRLRAFSTRLQAIYQKMVDKNPVGIADDFSHLLKAGDDWLQCMKSDGGGLSEESQVFCTSMYGVLSIMADELEAANKTLAGKTMMRAMNIKVSDIVHQIVGKGGMLYGLAQLILPQKKPVFIETDLIAHNRALHSLSELIEVRVQLAVENIQRALDENEAIPMLELIRRHREDYDDLMVVASEEDRAAWEARLATLENPGIMRQLADSVLSPLQWPLQGYIPVTLERDSKDKLREFTHKLLGELKVGGDAKTRVSTEKANFIREAKLGDDTEMDALLDAPLGELFALYEDGWTLAVKLEEAQKKLEQDKTSQPKEKRKIVEMLKGLMAYFFKKSSEDRVGVYERVKQVIHGFVAGVEHNFSEMKRKFSKHGDVSGEHTPSNQTGFSS